MIARTAAPWVALVAGLVAMGVAVVPAPDDDVAVGTVPVAAGPVPPSLVTRAVVAPSPALAAPTRLRAPTLGVDALVVPVGVDRTGSLQVPDDPAVVGWWRDGASPGAPAGTVVLDGHVDSWSAGPGALFRLVRLRPGDPLSVVTAAGVRTYAVDAVRRYPKPDLPSETFDRTGRPRLVLISCGGAFDRRLREYADNVVVYATPT